MDSTGTALVGIRAARVQATSARPCAPTLAPTRAERRAERRAHHRRTRGSRPDRVRAALASSLHRAGDALAPRSGHVGHPAR